MEPLIDSVRHQCDIRGCGGVAVVTLCRVDSQGRHTPKRGIVQLCEIHGDAQWDEIPNAE